MSENKYNPDGKDIRFIDTQYNTLFTIPDGGSIVITHPDGKQYIGVCKFIDETHTDISGSCYHIHQFAAQTEKCGAKVEPESEPEMVGSYRVTHRFPVGDKVYVMGHSPEAVQSYATWQAYRDSPGKDFGHYWPSRSDAWYDLNRRVDAERTGRVYDHTEVYRQPKKRDDGAR